MIDAKPGLVLLKCPKCSQIALALDFDACYAALRAHPLVKLPPVPRSMMREALLAQLEAVSPYWTCGGCAAAQP
jgi:hypothetical protein